MSDVIDVDGFRSVQSDGRDYRVMIKDEEPVPLGPVRKVYIAHPHYILFTDPDDELWYATDATLANMGEDFNTLWREVQSVKSLPMQNAENMKDAVYSSLSTAIGCGFEKDYSTARDAVEQAKRILLEASVRKAKTWYVPTATIVGLILSAIGLTWYVTLLTAPDAEEVPSILRILAASMGGGSIGALLSAIGARSSGSSFDPFATRKAAHIDGALRIVYGIVTAFIITLAVEAQVVTSVALTSDQTNLSLLIVAIAGGFAERWAEDIVRGIRPSGE